MRCLALTSILWMLVIIINRPLIVLHGSLLGGFLRGSINPQASTHSPHLLMFRDRHPQLQTPLSPFWHLLQWPLSCKRNAFWAPDKECLFLLSSGWRRMLLGLLGPDSTSASQPTSLAAPSSQGNVLSPSPLRVYRRKCKSHITNSYMANLTSFIGISQANKAYFHCLHHIVVLSILVICFCGPHLVLPSKTPVFLSHRISEDPVMYGIFPLGYFF